MSRTSLDAALDMAFFDVAIIMFAVMQALTTFLTEVRHQSSHPTHRAVSAFALLMLSQSFLAAFNAWSATSRIEDAWSLVSIFVNGVRWEGSPASLSGVWRDTRDANSG